LKMCEFENSFGAAFTKNGHFLNNGEI